MCSPIDPLTIEQEWYEHALPEWNARGEIPPQDVDRMLGTYLPLLMDAEPERFRGAACTMAYVGRTGIEHEDALLEWREKTPPTFGQTLVVLGALRRQAMQIATRARAVRRLLVVLYSQADDAVTIGRGGQA